MIELRVIRISDATPRIRTFEFAAADGGGLPTFTAGAHIDVELGNGEERSYSLLNDQGDTQRYKIAVLREQSGRGGSAWMHAGLREGDIVRVSEPSNNFRLSEAGERHILIAGGIGVTPIISMAARLQQLGRDYQVHYCAREPSEAAFAEEIRSRHGDKAKFYFDGGDPARGLDVVSLLEIRPSSTHVYVCGPAGLIRATREAGRDWPMGTVHFELFKGLASDTAAGVADHPFQIVLAKSGATLEVPAGRSILDVLKDNGFRIKSLCKEGVCGTCRVGVLSGKVDHRDDCLDDDDRETTLQACVSRALPGERLVLDI